MSESHQNGAAGDKKPRHTKRGGHESTAMRADARLPPLLNSLADWLNDFQYRVLARLLLREIRRQGITLPDYKQKVVDELTTEMGENPKNLGKLEPVPIPEA